MGRKRSRRDQNIETGWVETASAYIYYEAEGSGTPVLMLHGNGQSHKVFASYASLLAEQYRVILPDSRGHGNSREKNSKSPEEFSTADMAADMRELADRLGFSRVILFGYSDGANIALEFASLFPERTLAVISISGNALPDGLFRPVYLSAAAKYYAAGLLELAAPAKKKGRWRRTRRRLALLIHSPQLKEERLATITAPVLLIAGTIDLIRTAHTKWMAEKIPSCRLWLVPFGTHGTFFHRRRTYQEHIMAFLKENGL